jgi:hypothetical protein
MQCLCTDLLYMQNYGPLLATDMNVSDDSHLNMGVQIIAATFCVSTTSRTMGDV